MGFLGLALVLVALLVMLGRLMTIKLFLLKEISMDTDKLNKALMGMRIAIENAQEQCDLALLEIIKLKTENKESQMPMERGIIN